MRVVAVWDTLIISYFITGAFSLLCGNRRKINYKRAKNSRWQKSNFLLELTEKESG